jgi:hypothetical protein
LIIATKAKEGKMSFYPATYIPMDASASDRVNLIVDNFLTPKLVRFRQIEVNDESLTLDHDRETWLFAWGNILQSAPLRITRAGERIAVDDISVDYEYGKVTFDDVEDGRFTSNSENIEVYGPDGRPLVEVTASYTFDYFPVNVLEGFLRSACNIVNSAGDSASPTSYSLEKCPEYWHGVLTDLAFAMCMERLLLDYDLWKGRLIFALGADMILEGMGGDIVGQLTTLKQNAEQRAYKTIDNKTFKSGGRVLAYPTNNYYRAISTIGMSGQRQMGGRLRGWKINRLGR